MAGPGAHLGTAYISIEPDFDKFNAGVDRQLNPINQRFRKIGEDTGRQFGGGLGRGLDDTSTKTRRTRKDVDGFAGTVSLLDGQFKKAGGGAQLLGRNINLVKPAGLVTGLGLAAQGASALAAGAVAVVGALGPLAGVAGAAAVGLTAAGQAAGTFSLATMGVGAAIKEQLTAHTAAASAATNSAASQRAAARAIQSAEDGVADAKDRVRQAGVALAAAHRGELQATEDLTQAERDAWTAVSALSDARAQARRNLEDLHSAVTDAILGEARATQTLEDARAALAQVLAGPSEQDLADGHNRVQDAILNETRATQGLEDARASLEALLAGPSAEDTASAHEKVADASRAQERATLNLKKVQAAAQKVLDSSTATDDEKAAARLDLADAEDRVTDAVTAGAKAQKDLTALETGPDPKKIERARTDVAEAEQRVKEAREGGSKAQKDLAALEAGPDPKKIADARTAVAEAEVGLATAVRDRTRDQAALTKAEKDGVNGSPDVVSALQAVADANTRVKNAEQGVRDARRTTSDAEKDLAKAHRDVARAIQDVADAQASAAESTAGATTGAKNLNAAFDALPPAAQAFVRQLIELKPKLDELRNTAAQGLFPGVGAGLDAVMNNFGPVKRVIGETAEVLGDLARKAGELVGSPAWGSDIETVGKRNAGIIGTVGDAALDAADGMRHVVVAAGPLTTWLAKLTAGWAEQFDASAKAGRESGALAGFFDKTRAVIERLVSIGGNLATAFLDIGKAAAPLGNDILAALDKASEGLKNWTGSVAGQNALKKYFDDVKPAIFEVGRLVRDVVNGFARISAEVNLAPMIEQIRTKLLPAFEELVASTTASFGPHFIDAVTEILRLFTQMTGSNSALTLFVDLIGTMARALADLLENNPELKAMTASIFGFAAVAKALNLAAAVTGLKSLSSSALAAGAAYRSLAAGATVATVAEERGLVATAAARTAALASAAATAVATAAKSAWIFVMGGELALLTAVTLATVRQRVATMAATIATQGMATAQLLLNAAMAANPIFLVVLGLAALAAGLIYAYQHSETFRKVVDTMFDALKDGFDWVKEHWPLLLAILTGPIGLAVYEIATHVDEIVGFFKALPGRIVDGIKAAPGALLDAGKWVVNRLVDGAKALGSAIADAAGWVKNRFVEFIHAEIEGIKAIGSWIVNRIVDGFKFVTDLLAGVGSWLKNRIVEFIHAEIDGVKAIGGWVLNRIVDGFTTVTDALGAVGGWVKNRIVELVHDAGDGFKDLGGWVIDKIVDGLRGGANLFVDFVNELIDIINKIPGVDIGHVKHLAQGGTLGREMAAGAGQGSAAFQAFAAGGKVTAPMAIVGEEAPRHPEFVIPTNPAYRGRALGLYGQLSKELKIPGFKVGGILGGAGDLLSGAFDFVKDGASGIIGKLPGVGNLPPWIKDTGRYALKQVGEWIKHKVGSLLGGGDDGDGGGGTVGKLARMISFADRLDSMDIPYGAQGHAGWALNKLGEDCSSTVSKVLHSAGFLDSVKTTVTLPGALEKGAGQYITVHDRPLPGDLGHTIMQIGNRFFGTSGQNPGGGPGWITASEGYLDKMSTKLHPPGLAKGGLLGPKGVITSPFVGSYLHGGVVPADGLAYVHQGETITPAGGDGDTFLVDVHVDDPTLKDLVRVEIRKSNKADGAEFRAGALSR